jgi:hypothetical protein
MISNNVVVTILSKEFDRKASDISDGVGASLLTASGTESKENWGFFPNSTEEFGSGKVRDVVCDFEFAPSPSSFGMNDSMQYKLSYARS